MITKDTTFNELVKGDVDTFKNCVSSSLSDDLTKLLDELIIENKLTFTQKLDIQNLRDRGIIDAIIIGDFTKLTVFDLIDVFSIFKCGFTVHKLDYSDYVYDNKYSDRLQKH